MNSKFKEGDEVIIFDLPEPGQEYYKDYTLNKIGKIIQSSHPHKWIAIEGVTDSSGNQLWVHPAGVRRVTKLDKILK
jgi:hypothetical protein